MWLELSLVFNSIPLINLCQCHTVIIFFQIVLPSPHFCPGSWKIPFQGMWTLLLEFWWGFHWIFRLLLGNVGIFTLLILLYHHENKRFFHLLISISISQILNILSNKLFTWYFKVTLIYFILFAATLFLRFFYSSFVIFYIGTIVEGYWIIYYLILQSATFLKFYIICSKLVVELLGSLVHTVISSTN